jgi:hypothetical protein
MPRRSTPPPPPLWFDRLPSFATAAAVPSDWRRYLERVYGNVSALRYPFDVRRLSFFYVGSLPASAQPRNRTCDRSMSGCLNGDVRPLLGLKHPNTSQVKTYEALQPVVRKRGRWRRRKYSGRAYREVYSLYPINESRREATAWVYLWHDTPLTEQPSSHPPFPGRDGYPSGSRIEVFHRFEDLEDYCALRGLKPWLPDSPFDRGSVLNPLCLNRDVLGDGLWHLLRRRQDDRSAGRLGAHQQGESPRRRSSRPCL